MSDLNLNTNYDVIIVGAGLAGCSAAIQLAQLDYRVLLLEQQHYPAHKLCGEFLSVEVLSMFDRLGILPAVEAVGAKPIRHAYLTTAGGKSFRHELPGIALGLSRYQLDWILFQRSATVGAICHDGTVVKNITGDLTQGFQVNTNRGNVRGKFVLAAHGKRSGLDHKLDRPFTQKTSPWVAYKGHYSGLELPGLLELHAFDGGYCGLSQIETGQVNLCWIGHQRVLRNTGADTSLPAALWQNPVLADRLKVLQLDAPGHRLSNISLAMKGNFEGDICFIGDTAGMIPPMCGDGMAMALRTAEIAVPLVDEYLRSILTITSFKQKYRRAWRSEFQLRLKLGGMLHQCFVQPPIADVTTAFCQTFPIVGDWMIRKTRGEAVIKA
jgi:menaquinone-9 beta-reductase